MIGTRLAALVALTLLVGRGYAASLGGRKTQAPKSPVVKLWSQTAEFPHDPDAFTQGLEVWGETYFLESTGQYGRSDIRKVERKTGKVVSQASLDRELFAEGVTRLGEEIFQLTWREGLILKWRFTSKKGFTLDSKSMWSGEGWGITKGLGSLWVSNGSSVLTEVDSRTLKPKRSIKVTLSGEEFDRLNELEFKDGKILANVYMSSTIVEINPKTGVIDGLIDLGPLTPKGLSIEAVANGIAWDESNKRLYVTGKNWPKVFELKLK